MSCAESVDDGARLYKICNILETPAHVHLHVWFFNVNCNHDDAAGFCTPAFTVFASTYAMHHIHVHVGAGFCNTLTDLIERVNVEHKVLNKLASSLLTQQRKKNGRLVSPTHNAENSLSGMWLYSGAS
jgi:hypothetical protein